MEQGFAQRLLALRLWLQRRLRINDWQIALWWAVPAGVLGALATEGFRAALSGLDHAVLGQGGGLVALARSLPPWARVLTPTAGGLIAGLLLVAARRWATDRDGSDYMESVTVGNGHIPFAHTVLRSSSSLFSIASGGSIGREGPMIQLAALGASLLGRALRMPLAQLRLIVACGAAAGITAAYNAPIAAAFFVAEIVLGSIAMESLGPIMVAAVVSNIVMRAFPGYAPAYEMPPFPVVTGPEVLLFALLGLLIGPAAATIFRGLHAARAAFARVPLPLPWRLALGGLVVGLISVQVPEVWGNGYSVVNQMLHHPLTWTLLALLFSAKLAATLATVGSGAVGGMFTPALFFGCALGTLFGHLAQALWPGTVSAPFAYGIVGMGAFLAAATQAPIMAVLMIFEMTLSYEVMLPLMATCVVAYFVSRSLPAPSMFGITAWRRGQENQNLRLRAQHMRDMVQPAQTVVGPQADMAAMSRLFLQYPFKYLYVTDNQQRFLGVVPLKSMSTLQRQEAAPPPHAVDLLSQEIAPLTADMGLGAALQRFLDHRGERLPVVESPDNPVLIGVVYKSTLLDTYVRLSGESQQA